MNIINDLKQWSPIEGDSRARALEADNSVTGYASTFLRRAFRGFTQGMSSAKQDVQHAAENIRDNVASKSALIRDNVAQTGSKLKDTVSDIQFKPVQVPRWGSLLGLAFWWAPGVTTTLLNCGLITLAVQALGWILHSFTGIVAHHDILGVLNIVGIALYSFMVQPVSTLRQWLLTACVAIWGLRLCAYLVDRFKDEGVDRALVKVRTRRGRTALWIFQSVWVFITALPILLSNAQCGQKSTWWNRPPHYDTLIARDYIGLLMWAAGFAIETIADWQKAQFRKRQEGQKPNQKANIGQDAFAAGSAPANASASLSSPSASDLFLKTGLWRYSRHPNYFGEILMWFGLFISASSVLQGGWQKAFAALSPLLMAFRLRFITGVPRVEAQSDRAFKGIQSYQAYKKRTPLIMPFL